MNDTQAEIHKYIELLSSADHQARTQACISLGNLGAKAKAAVPALIQIIREQNEGLREVVISTVGQIGESAVPALINKFKSEHETWDTPAGIGLRRIGKASIPALEELLTRQDPTLRDKASNVLGLICVDLKIIAPALIRLINDDDQWIQIGAIGCIREIGRDALEAAPALIEALRNNSSNNVSWCAAMALGKTRCCSREAITALLEALNYDDRDIYLCAAMALSDIGEPAVPFLIDRLRHKEGKEEDKVLVALGMCGKNAIPHLAAIMADKDEVMRQKAAKALRKIGHPAISELTGLSQDNSMPVRLEAIHGLGQIGRRHKYAPPGLLKALKDEDKQVRFQAFVWLSRINEQSPVPTMMDALRDQEMRSMVSERLSEIGRSALPLLTEALNDHYLHSWAAETLVKLHEKRGCRR